MKKSDVLMYHDTQKRRPASDQWNHSSSACFSWANMYRVEQSYFYPESDYYDTWEEHLYNASV